MNVIKRKFLFFLPGLDELGPGEEKIMTFQELKDKHFLESLSGHDWELGIAANTYPDNNGTYFCFASEYGWHVNCSGCSDISEYYLVDLTRDVSIVTIERPGSVEQFNMVSFVDKETAIDSFRHFLKTGERHSNHDWIKIGELETQNEEGRRRQLEKKKKFDHVVAEHKNRGSKEK